MLLPATVKQVFIVGSLKYYGILKTNRHKLQSQWKNEQSGPHKNLVNGLVLKLISCCLCNITQLCGVQEWQQRPTKGLFRFSSPSFHVLATQRSTEGLVLRSLTHRDAQKSIIILKLMWNKWYWWCVMSPQGRLVDLGFVAYRVVVGVLPTVTPLLSIVDLKQQAIWQLHILYRPFCSLQITHH